MSKNNYATVITESGVNYREIADTMTEMGYPMNHSSARNYVLRIMKKFMFAVAKEYDIVISESKIDSIIKSATFQSGVADLLSKTEARRRTGNTK